MRVSYLFGKTTKSISADEESVNAKLLIRAGFIAKQLAGVYNYLPLGLRVLGKIQNIIREEMNAIGANEILMPAMTQEESYDKTGRSAMDVLFKFEGQGGAKLVLNPTHEEVVTPLAQKFVFSYQDLPVAVYQIQNKFRNEPRAKSGLLRGREFNMKDLYSFHADETDLDKYYELAKAAYFKIYARLGLGDGRTVLTYASGGVFSKYSHEFQTLAEAGEDTVFLCDKCRVAVNKEIIDEQKTCPVCGGGKLEEKNGIEVGNIFKLKTKFSDAFNFQYKDAAGKEQPVIMGCYGMGPSRVMGTIVEVFHDDKGIIWPEAVAPYRVHLLVLGKEEAVGAEAEKIYKTLIKEGIEVLFDDRERASAGEKLSDADLIGLPYRVIVSAKTLAEKSVEIKKRDAVEAKLVATKSLLKELA
ncbi:MAG: His/Gly/Thr/Pro-type tRNA ligase C-terminal domain-containing protein [Patescibacteria group bacterium]|nr:His/Gly/Thr/Pro-type tRNA ligase C-terminal domain-containing protein [Patescibacteria group bacterium]